jgi:hypothetical protein
MNIYRIFLPALFTILLAFSTAGAQDPGLPDTVKLEGGPLKLNQSVPLTLTLVNDVSVAGYTLGFVSTSIDGGFATYDSIVYVNRMADPAIFGMRHVNIYDADGIPPDSVLIGGYAAGLTLPIPPGNDAIALVYFSGQTTGQMVLDSAFLPSAAPFILVTEAGTPYSPEFVTETFEIIEGNALPEMTLSEESPRSVTGDDVAFYVNGSSPEDFPTELKLVSLVGYDDESRLPTGEPTFVPGDPGVFSWTPDASDIGIWQATFRVTDSAGQSVEAGTDIQVVENSAYLISFLRSVLIDVGHSFGLHHGNFDDDPAPEIFTTGNSYFNVPVVELFDYEEPSGLTRVFSIDEYRPRAGPQIGYFDEDDFLDGLAIGISPTEQSVEIWHGNGDNSLSVTSEYTFSGFVPYSACLGEFTGDGYLDYAAVRSNLVNIYDGSTTPAFQKINTIGLGQISKAVNSADFNNDGYDDLAVGLVTGIQIYLNNGTGGFIAGAFYSQEYGTVDIAVTNEGSDFNGDGNFGVQRGGDIPRERRWYVRSGYYPQSERSGLRQLCRRFQQ